MDGQCGCRQRKRVSEYLASKTFLYGHKRYVLAPARNASLRMAVFAHMGASLIVIFNRPSLQAAASAVIPAHARAQAGVRKAAPARSRQRELPSISASNRMCR